MGKTQSPCVLIIGMDGATPNLIIPWARDGKLPNMAQFWKVFDSTSSPVEWKAISVAILGEFDGTKNPVLVSGRKILR